VKDTKITRMLKSFFGCDFTADGQICFSCWPECSQRSLDCTVPGTGCLAIPHTTDFLVISLQLLTDKIVLAARLLVSL